MADIPPNLAQYIPGGTPAGSAPIPPKTAPNASQGSGIGSYLSGVISKAKSGLGALFGGSGGIQTAASPAPQSGIPDNLAKYLPKEVLSEKPPAAPAPAPVGPQPPPKGVVPDNLQPFLSAQKKTDPAAAPDGNPKSPTGALFNTQPSTTDSGTDESTPQYADTVGTNEESQVKFFKDFMGATPGATYTTLKDVAQSLPRTAEQLGISIGQAAIAHTKYASHMTAALDTPADMKFLLGKDPITGLAFDVASWEDSIKNSPFAQKTGLAKYALPLAFTGVVGGDVLNFAPFGGEGDEALVKALVKEKTTEGAAALLRKTGLDESLVQDLAPEFAAMKTKEQVRDALGVSEKLHAALTSKGETDELVEPKQTPLDAAPEKPEGEPAPGENPAPEKPEAGEGGNIRDIESSDTPGERAPEPDERYPSRNPDTESSGESVPEKLKPLAQEALKYKSAGDFIQSLKDKSKFHWIDVEETAKHDENASPSGSVHYGSDTEKPKMVGPYGEVYLTPDTIRVGKEIKRINADAKESGPQAFPEGDWVVTKVNPNGTFEAVPKALGNTSLTDFYNQSAGDRRASAPSPEIQKNLPPPASPSSFTSIQDIMRGKLSSAPEAVEEKPVEDIKPPKPVEIDAGASSQGSALYESYEGGITSGNFKGWNPTTVTKFQDFVNRRKADTLQAVGAVVRQRFELLRKEGINGILRFEGFEQGEDGRIVESKGPDRRGIYGDIQKTNDGFYSAEVEAGVPVTYRANYLRMYLRDPATGQEFVDGVPIGGRKVGTSASFAQPRDFKTYAEAIEAGYQPIFDNVPDIMSMRAQESERAIANSNFFRHLAESGNLVPAPAADEARQGFVSYDPDRFPTQTVRYTDPSTGVRKEYTGVFKGPKPVVNAVNRYLRDPDPTLKTIAEGVGSVKNFALSIGVPDLEYIASRIPGLKRFATMLPSTSFSIHYWNIAARDVVSSLTHPSTAWKEIPKFLSYGFNSRRAQRYIQANLERALPLFRAGMTGSAEEHSLDALDLQGLSGIEKAGSIGKRVAVDVHNAFGRGTFSRVIPARKIDRGLQLANKYIAEGLAEDQAYRLAAEQVNTLYGGVNWESFGRSKNYQNVLRAIFIAPDFGDTNRLTLMGMGKGVGRLFKTPQSVKDLGEAAMKMDAADAKAYRNFGVAFLGTFIAANLLNYEQSGKWMYENDPLHQLSIAWGKDANGKTRYINPFGTGFDWIRIPMQVAASFAQKKYNDVGAVLRNRLSIPLASFISMTFNIDWAGDKIYGTDNYGNPIPTATAMQNILDNTIGNALPSSVQGTGQAFAGKNSLEQAITQGVGLPVSYTNENPNTTTIKQLEADAKIGIANGDYTLYYKLIKANVIPARSRGAFIRSALTNAKTARQLRTSAKAKAKLATEEKALESEGFSK